MMKEMIFSPDVSTRHVFGWVSFIWFTTAVGVAVGQGVELQTVSQLAARCGENVTLTCDASSSGKLDIISFTWLGKSKSLCSHEDGQTDPEVLCESTAQPPHQHRLTLTLLNVMPVDQGTYICKVRSRHGSKADKTNVSVQDCLQSNGSSINESHAKCWFSGVYPTGVVYWFQGSVNLTDRAGTQGEVDQHGRYNVSSTVEVQKGNRIEPYACSLWIPSSGKYLYSQDLYFKEEQTVPKRSSGGMATLQWMCMVGGLMMVTFTT